MRELYIRRRWMEIGKAVPVKVRRFEPKPREFDMEVKKQLNLLGEESVELKRLSEKGKSIREKFGQLVERMIKIVQEEGCYYPEIEKEVSSVVLRSGGPAVSAVFHGIGVGEQLRRVPKNCKAF